MLYTLNNTINKIKQKADLHYPVCSEILKLWQAVCSNSLLKSITSKPLIYTQWISWLPKRNLKKCKCVCLYQVVWYPLEFSRPHNLHPWYWNSLLCNLISSGKNSAHFLQLMLFTILQLLFHQVPITAVLTEVAWYERLAWHLYTWSAAWLVHRSPIEVLTGCHLTSVMWQELHTTRPYATKAKCVKINCSDDL